MFTTSHLTCGSNTCHHLTNSLQPMTSDSWTGLAPGRSPIHKVLSYRKTQFIFSSCHVERWVPQSWTPWEARKNESGVTGHFRGAVLLRDCRRTFQKSRTAARVVAGFDSSSILNDIPCQVTHSSSQEEQPFQSKSFRCCHISSDNKS